MTDSSQDPEPLSWEISVPLWTDPLMLGATFKLCFFTVLVSAGLLSVVFLAIGEPEAVASTWMVFSLVGVGLFIAMLLVMALVFGNRMHYRYRIDAEGIRFEILDRRARGGSRLAMLAGVLAGKPQALGAGLLARVREVVVLRWRGAFRAEYMPTRGTIALANRWRRLLLVHCLPDRYGQVAARIAAEIERHGSATRIPERSPLPRFLAWSAVVAIATLPLFGLVAEFGVPLMLPLLMLCFGLATVWLIGVFGWVLLLLDLAILAALLVDATTLQESFIHRGEQYLRYTRYASEDWALLTCALLGMAALGWIGWRAARGRLPSLLASDSRDAGD